MMNLRLDSHLVNFGSFTCVLVTPSGWFPASHAQKIR